MSKASIRRTAFSLEARRANSLSDPADSLRGPCSSWRVNIIASRLFSPSRFDRSLARLTENPVAHAAVALAAADAEGETSLRRVFRSWPSAAGRCIDSHLRRLLAANSAAKFTAGEPNRGRLATRFHKLCSNPTNFGSFRPMNCESESRKLCTLRPLGALNPTNFGSPTKARSQLGFAANESGHSSGVLAAKIRRLDRPSTRLNAELFPCRLRLFSGRLSI